MLNLVLLAGKLAFLVLLYLFVLMIVRAAVRDVWAASARQAAADPAAVPGRAYPQAAKQAQGEATARLVTEESPSLEKGSSIEVFSGEELVIGRSQDADLWLRDTFVSGRHARVGNYTDGVWVEDLGSTNGTFVNGTEIEGMTPLSSGDRVEIGDSVLRVEVVQ